MTEYTYGPWIAHNGDELPASPDALVQDLIDGELQAHSEAKTPVLAVNKSWHIPKGHPLRIIAYRIAAPKPEPVAGERVFALIGGSVLTPHFTVEPPSQFVTLPTLDDKLVSCKCGMCRVEDL